MRRNRLVTLLVVGGALFAGPWVLPSLGKVQEKLGEIVRRTGGNVSFLINRQISPADMSELTTEADLIIRGLVVEAHSRLTTNEQEIETDYTVLVLEVYDERRLSPASRKIVVSKPGGTVNLHGVSVTMIERDFPQFENNEEYILFLRQDPKRSANQVVYGSQGAFRLEDGHADQVSTSTGKIKQERGKLPLETLVREIRDAALKR